MIRTALYLLGCQLAGEAFVALSGLPLPGAVLGMVLMLAMIGVCPAIVAQIRVGGAALLRLMPVLFVPAGVGVVAQGGYLKSDGAALFIAFFVSTLLAVLAAAITFAAVARWRGLGDE